MGCSFHNGCCVSWDGSAQSWSAGRSERESLRWRSVQSGLPIGSWGRGRRRAPSTRRQQGRQLRLHPLVLLLERGNAGRHAVERGLAAKLLELLAEGAELVGAEIGR